MIPTQFIIEILGFVVLIILLKIFWNPKVRYYFMHTVILLNAIAIFLYFNGAYLRYIEWADALPKIVLHSIVILVINTLNQLSQQNEQ